MQRLEPSRGPTRQEATRLIRVLAIAPNASTLAELESFSAEGTRFSVDATSSLAEGVALLERRDFDAVLVEIPFTRSGARRVLSSLRETAPEAALVALAKSPDAALYAMEHDADDYLVLGAFDETLCVRVLRHAIERKAWQRQLKRCLRESTLVHERLGVGLFELDLQGGLKAANDAFCRMLGREPDEPDSEVGLELFRSQRQFKAWFKELEGARGLFRRQLAFNTRGGGEVVGMTCVHACHDSLGRKVGYRGAMMDITAIANRAEQLPYEACHDLDTGLYNARMFERTLKRELEQVTADHPVAVCRIRIDIAGGEDLYGKRFARELIKSLSVVVWDKMRRNDVLARLDEDSFGAIFAAGSSVAAMERVWHIVERIKSIRFDWAGDVHYVDAAAGVVLVDDAECDPDAILVAADNACETARAEARPAAFGKPGPTISRRNVEAMRWSSRLRTALAEGTMSLHFQPIVPINRSEGSRARYDVFARYVGTDGKVYRPSAFMPAVRRYNMSGMFDLSVIGTLLRSDEFSSREGRARWFVVRLSDQTLAEPKFPDRLRTHIEMFSFPRRLLCLAVRQEAVHENGLAFRRLVDVIKMLGCEVMLEQFGELVSASVLRELKPNYVRLSPPLLRGLATDRVRRKLVQGLVGLASVTGARVVAPFVEDSDVIPILQECGVDYAQGFAFGIPQPDLRFETKLRR